jgi:hypothetical protein
VRSVVKRVEVNKKKKTGDCENINEKSEKVWEAGKDFS